MKTSKIIVALYFILLTFFSNQQAHSMEDTLEGTFQNPRRTIQTERKKETPQEYRQGREEVAKNLGIRVTNRMPIDRLNREIEVARQEKREEGLQNPKRVTLGKCRYFNGNPDSCRYGEDCKFSHDTFSQNNKKDRIKEYPEKRNVWRQRQVIKPQETQSDFMNKFAITAEAFVSYNTENSLEEEKTKPNLSNSSSKNTNDDLTTESGELGRVREKSKTIEEHKATSYYASRKHETQTGRKKETPEKYQQRKQKKYEDYLRRQEIKKKKYEEMSRMEGEDLGITDAYWMPIDELNKRIEKAIREEAYKLWGREDFRPINEIKLHMRDLGRRLKVWDVDHIPINRLCIDIKDRLSWEDFGRRLESKKKQLEAQEIYKETAISSYDQTNDPTRQGWPTYFYISPSTSDDGWRTDSNGAATRRISDTHWQYISPCGATVDVRNGYACD